MENSYKFPVYILAGPTTKRICYLENNLLIHIHLKHAQVKLKIVLMKDSNPDQSNKMYKLYTCGAFCTSAGKKGAYS